MNKKRLENALRLLKNNFGEFDHLNEAFSFLQEKISQIKEEQTMSERNFPLPQEVKSPSSFALFSDGACRGNPGPGAWGCMVQNSKGDLLISASEVSSQTTNNQMELMGAIMAIELLRGELGNLKQTELFLFTDSKYLVDGLNKWVSGWKARGWKKADKKPPENLALWKRLDDLYQSYNLKVSWVKGHAGHPQNEYCDQLANKALDTQGY